MIAHFLNELLGTVVHALPRVFLFGAPVLLITIAIAALVDARLHLTDDHPATKHVD